MNYLPRLALNCNPPVSCLLSQDYRHEPLTPSPVKVLDLGASLASFYCSAFFQEGFVL
jgi:hypothetical protein